jgi:ferredoxin-NADP reductase
MATISRAKVVEINPISNDVREYILKPEKYNYFDPGTFLQLTLENLVDGNRWPESRNFSIASSENTENTIRLIIKKIGNYTARIFNELNVGSFCFIKYSFGDFLLPFYDSENKIICIAGGTGIAPILSFAEYLNKIGQKDRLVVFYSSRKYDSLIKFDLLVKAVIQENLNIYLSREKNEKFKFGRINTNDVIKKSDDISKDHFYICGGEDFTNTFKVNLKKAGAENIYSDEW